MIILDIAANELCRTGKSPFAWIILAVMQFLLAIFFFLLLSQYLQITSPDISSGLTDVVAAGTLQTAGLLLLMVSPFLTMRLFSDEQRGGTLNLLMSSPVSMTEMVLGKYLGIVTFLLCMLMLIALMPLSLLFGTNLDLGQLACGLIGLALLMSSFAAIGLFISTLTRQPAVAAISTFGLLFLLWIIHITGNTGNEKLMAILSYLSMLRHYNNFLSGMFNSIDIIYYLLISAIFIVLSIWRLDALRTLP
ncbi:MAG: ABC transporter permease subunit [Gammaproteobacteria bacterium]